MDMLPNRASIITVLLPWLAVPATALGQQVDTVRVGDEALVGAALSPGSYLLENFRRDGGADSLVSTTRQTVRRAEAAGRPAWIIETEHASDDTTRSSIVVRADDFSLIHHRVKASRDSAAVSANHDLLTGWVALPDQPVRLLDRRLEHPVFPVEGQIPWLFPLLPLEVGYEAAMPHFNQWSGEESWKEIRVVDVETIEVAGENRKCWRVDGGELFRGYGVTYWVDRASRRIVRGVARGEGDGPVYSSRLAEE